MSGTAAFWLAHRSGTSESPDGATCKLLSIDNAGAMVLGNNCCRSEAAEEDDGIFTRLLSFGTKVESTPAVVDNFQILYKVTTTCRSESQQRQLVDGSDPFG